MFSKQGKNMFTAGHFYLKLIGSTYKMFLNALIAFLLSPVTTQPNMSEHRTLNWPKKNRELLNFHREHNLFPE